MNFFDGMMMILSQPKGKKMDQRNWIPKKESDETKFPETLYVQPANVHYINTGSAFFCDWKTESLNTKENNNTVAIYRLEKITKVVKKVERTDGAPQS